MSEPVRWGLLSTAAIGSVVIAANQDSATTRFVRPGAAELVRDGATTRVPADPDGFLGLRGEEGDVYRVEFDAVSTAIRTGTPWPYGKDDAVAQARVLAALHSSGATGLPVEPST